MKAMKIDLQAQRKTCIESNLKPQSKAIKNQTQHASGGLTDFLGGLTDSGGLTDLVGGLTARFQN